MYNIAAAAQLIRIEEQERKIRYLEEQNSYLAIQLVSMYNQNNLLKQAMNKRYNAQSSYFQALTYYLQKCSLVDISPIIQALNRLKSKVNAVASSLQRLSGKYLQSLKAWEEEKRKKEKLLLYINSCISELGE